MIEREQQSEQENSGQPHAGVPRGELHVAGSHADEPHTAEPHEQPPQRVVDDTAGVHRLGRGVRWSDIVAMIERDRLASEAARKEAA
ncbi:DUF6222 family protein [Haloechinothrix halophila]|uniref:DUF6222 family protein n=1 Tax=Haloechinothrix halophila TaxID=1069073 RepID=UPI0003F8A3BC|nr:DUF6222 family protein [Haloechinothrix halophila]